MRKTCLVAAAVTLLLSSTSALAHPGDAVRGIEFQPGNDQLILMASVQGVFISGDDGQTWHWMCSEAVGGGVSTVATFGITTTGAIFATAFEGVRFTRDGGCTWQNVATEPLATQFASDLLVAADDRIWTVTGNAGEVVPNDVFVSADDGVTFSPTGLDFAGVVWNTIIASKTDPDRVYVAGFFLPGSDPDAGTAIRQVLYRTSNGGTSWTELPTDDFNFLSGAQIRLRGVSPVDPNTVFATANDPSSTETLYRSTDGGANWTAVLSLVDTIDGFHITDDGAEVFATVSRMEPGVHHSTNGGVDWSLLYDAPVLGCIEERGIDGDYFACGKAAPWRIGRSLDLARTWTEAFQFPDTAGPLECPAGTPQAEMCPALWPNVCTMLQVPGCVPSGIDAGPADVDAGTTKPPKKGCGGCQLGFVGLFFLWPFRTRSRR